MQHKILALHAVGLAIVAQWSAAHVVATVLQPHEGAVLDVGYTRLRVLLSAEDTNGAFSGPNSR